MSQMSATGSAYAEDGFRVGRVLGRSFGVLGRHFVQFLLVTAIPIVPLAYVIGVELVSAVGVKHPDPTAMARLGLLMMAAVAFWGVAIMIAQAIVLYGTFQDMRGKSMSFGEAIIKGFARFFPIIGLAICTLIAVGTGLMLLVIPGIIFGLMFYVALPACVVERLGPIASMKRSIALTKGHRWKIFGILILIGLLSGIGGAVIATILTMVGGAKAMLIGRFVWQAIMGAFGAVVVAVIYHDLRAAREGIDVERMAAIFD
jgi:MFS family permease